MTHKTQRIEPSFSKWLEDLNFLSEMSQRIKTLLKKWLEELIFWKISIKIKKLFWWLTELNFFFKKKKHDSQNWIIFSRWLTELNPSFLTWLNDLIWTWLKEFFVEHDSNNWLSSFFSERLKILHTTQRIEPFFRIWPNESNLFWKYFQKNFQYDSQNWTSFSALPIE